MTLYTYCTTYTQIEVDLLDVYNNTITLHTYTYTYMCTCKCALTFDGRGGLGLCGDLSEAAARDEALLRVAAGVLHHPEPVPVVLVPYRHVLTLGDRDLVLIERIEIVRHHKHAPEGLAELCEICLTVSVLLSASVSGCPRLLGRSL